jgi:hypothetical protein
MAGSSEEKKLVIIFLEFIKLIVTSLAWTIASLKNRNQQGYKGRYNKEDASHGKLIIWTVFFNTKSVWIQTLPSL